MPQGSNPVAPYVNDFDRIFKYYQFHLFADDMAIHLKANSKSEIENELQIDLNNIYVYK